MATLRSERLRARVLFYTLAAIVGVAVFAFYFLELEALLTRGGHGGFHWYAPLLHIAPFLLYEAVIGFVLLDALLRRDLEPPALARYVNTVIEISAPTVLILFMHHNTGASAAFGALPSLIYFLYIVASVLRLNFSMPFFTGLVAAAQYLGAVWYALPLDVQADDLFLTPQLHAGKALVMVAAGAVAGLVALRVRRLIQRLLEEGAARQRVTSVFGQHVSPAVVERLLGRGGETSEQREVCVLFLDIANFTAWARTRPPAEVIDHLNATFASMIEAIDRHQGIINKFLGDGFMAVFGAPLDDPAAARNAVAAARAILAEIDRQAAEGGAEGGAGGGNAGSAAPRQVRIGIHAGKAVTGNVGSPRRKEFTVIGDTVNLAARLEQLNKELGSRLLVSEAVARGLPDGGAGAEIREIPIRGYERPVRVALLDAGTA